MTLSDYTFRLGDTGVVLNTDLSIPFVDIDKISGLDSAPYRETIRDHEGIDGGFIDAEFEQGREIFLEGTAYVDPTTPESYMDSLKYNFAPVQTPIPFYFKMPGISERLIFVKPRGVAYDIDTLRRIGMTRVQFKMYAEDPRMYTNSLISSDIPFSGFAGAGFSFSLGFNFGFGAAVTPPSTSVFNDGNRPAPAILTISGPVTNPRISNDTLGLTLSFQIVLSASDELVVDLGYRTVTLNGNINARGTLIDPDWWLLQPGSNSITYTAGSGGGSNVNISFRSAWR